MHRIALSIVLVVLVGLSGAPAAQERDEVREVLQAFGRDFDRAALEPDVVLTGPSGEPAQGVRCATRDPGELERALVGQALADFVRRQGTEHRDRTLEIPVVFHVARDGDRYDVADRWIDRQMEVLDDAYSGHGYRFRLASIRRYDNRRFARRCARPRVERRFKRRNAVDPARTLNVYTCRPARELLGWAYLPGDFPERHPMHGVVIHHGTLPGGGAAPFDEGDTLTHEVGHYLGLFHTFAGRCRDRDRVADTPAERRPGYGCPVGRDSCPNAPGLDPIHNYMDYGDDSCIDEFTVGQENRMDDQVARFRTALGEELE